MYKITLAYLNIYVTLVREIYAEICKEVRNSQLCWKSLAPLVSNSSNGTSWCCSVLNRHERKNPFILSLI